MLSSIACNPKEGVLEGGAALNDQAVQYVETRLDSASQAQSLFQGDLKSGIPSNFPNASVGSETISFAPNSDGVLTTNLQVSDLSTTSLGDGLSSVIDSAVQMPGGLGILAQLFKFLSSFFSATLQTVFDPNLIAQQAQSAVDLKKLMS